MSKNKKSFNKIKHLITNGKYKKKYLTKTIMLLKKIQYMNKRILKYRILLKYCTEEYNELCQEGVLTQKKVYFFNK